MCILSEKIGYEFRTISIFYEIMYILVKDYRVTETREKDIRHSRRLDALSKITTYMREHYKEDLKLSDLAATCWILGCIFVANVPKICKSQF